MDAVQVWWCKASWFIVSTCGWCRFGSVSIVSTCVDAKCNIFCGFQNSVWIAFHIWRNPHSLELINKHTKRERVIFVFALLRLLLLPFVPLLYMLSAMTRERERERLHSSSACVRLLSHSSSLSLCLCIDLCGRRNKKLNAKKLSNFHSKLL